jgi:nucleoid-associated protein YgaU
MGLLSFIKGAGEKLFGKGEAQAATQAAAAAPTPVNIELANVAASNAIMGYINAQNLTADDLSVSFDAAKGQVTVAGTAADQETKEKILLCCGNVQGVDQVDDQMDVATDEPESTYYTVKSGDTLSKIAKAEYGDAMAYQGIFEANTPMLSHPDKIYPGQVLRIPPQEA